MTVEELKIEAEKLGYSIIKKQESIKMLPCVCCGRRRRDLWWDATDGMCYFRCRYCGFAGSKAKNERQAKIKWNEAIEEVINV